jgi:hypothetical protein
MLNKPSIKFPLLYGSIIAITNFLFLMVFTKGLSVNPLGGKKEVLSLLLLPIGMIFAVKATRLANGGGLDFGKGFSACFSTTIIACALFFGLLYVFLIYVEPNLITEYINNTSLQMLIDKDQTIKNGISEEVFNDAFENIKKTDVRSIIWDDIIKKILIGIIPSLMISLYFRRRFID